MWNVGCCRCVGLYKISDLEIAEKVWKISLQLLKRHQVSLLGPALGVSTKCFEFLQKAGIVKRASQYYHLKSENRITIQ